MTYKRGHLAWTGAAIIAAGLALSPAFGAVSDLMHGSAVSLAGLDRVSAFTPTTKDSKLAAAYASVVQTGNHKGFRFTPVGGSMGSQRSITVLVRAGGDDGVRLQRTLPDLGITPVAFSLNVQRDWRKFAVADTGRKDLDPISAETLSAAKGFSIEKKSRFSTSALTDAKRDGASQPQTLVPEKTEALDLTSSYALSRNLNVTAGVRYHSQAGRLTPITDARADAQAVYFGTVFKF